MRTWMTAAICIAPMLVGSASAPRAAGGRQAPSAAFDQQLELHGITFHVTCRSDSPEPTLTITPGHLEIDNTVITRRIDGRVSRAEVADLDADGSPEIYVYVAATRGRAGTSLVAFSANRRKSLSEISLPPVTAGSKGAQGYRGRDEIRVVENSLVRRFPVFRNGDTDDKPTGGMRQIQYRLAHGEASWVLRVARVTSF